MIVLLLGDALTSEGEITNNPESTRAYDLLGERLPPDPKPSYGDELVIVHSDTFTTDDGPFQAKVETIARAVERTNATSFVRTFFRNHDPSLQSPDRRASVVFIGMGPDPEDNIERVVDTALAADGGPFDVTITGEWTADRDILQLSEDDLRKGEFFFGLPAALVILLLVFGAVVAGLVPLLLAIVSIVVALALTALVGQAFDLSVFVVNMLSGMGLALGIDYSLFILSRFREERAQGATRSTRSPRRARRRAGLCSSAGWRSCSRCWGW